MLVTLSSYDFRLHSGKEIITDMLTDNKFENIPPEIKDLDQWVLWKHEFEGDSPKKTPYQPNGKKAKTTDKATWSSFDSVLSAYTDDYAGIGFVLTETDPYTCVDFDKCVEGDDLNEEVYRWVSKFGSYAELSPSATGVHIWVKSNLKISAIKKPFAEIYQSGRYMTFTGDMLVGYDTIIENDSVLQDLIDFLQGKKQATPPPPVAHNTISTNRTSKNPADILEKLKKDSKAEQVLNSEINSENTVRFLNLLKLEKYCAGDATLIDQVVRLTPFARDKWDSKRGESTWGDEQIKFVLKDYDPNYRKPKDNLENKVSVTTTEKSGQKPIWKDYLNTLTNAGYKFSLNEMIDRIEVNGNQLTDSLHAYMMCELNERGLNNRNLASDAMFRGAKDNAYHPIKDYFESLVWDGQDHIAKLATYFTDDHDEIVYADGSKRSVFHAWIYRWLIGAVGKIYNPLSYQNPMLILDGGQNAGKSYFALWLCPIEGMSIESPINSNDKDHFGYLSSKFIWSVSELGASFRRSDREALKAILTQNEVTYRPAFGRYSLTKPATASFIGSVNAESGLLNDASGYRRFLPVKLTSINWDYAKDINKDQLWAQAYHLYKSGEKHTLSPEEKQIHDILTKGYEYEDPISDYLQRYFNIDKDNTEWFTPTVDLIHTVKQMGELKDNDKSIQMRLSRELDRLGLTKVVRRVTYKREKTQLRGYTGIMKTE